MNNPEGEYSSHDELLHALETIRNAPSDAIEDALLRLEGDYLRMKERIELASAAKVVPLGTVVEREQALPITAVIGPPTIVTPAQVLPPEVMLPSDSERMSDLDMALWIVVATMAAATIPLNSDLPPADQLRSWVMLVITMCAAVLGRR